MKSSPAASGVDRDRLRELFDARVERGARADFLLREAESRMLGRLDYIRLDPVVRVLDIGCGLGDAASALSARFPHSTFVGMDLSLATLRSAAAAHAPSRPRWWRPAPRRIDGPAWVCGDSHRIPIADGSIDLLWSNLVAHWFDDPPAVALEWRRVLRPGGLLMFSFFGVDTLREVGSAPESDSGPDPGIGFPAYPDLHDWGDVLVRAGFADPVMDVERLTLTYADGIALARDAEAIRAGVGGTAPTVLPPSGRVSVELVFGHAWRPATATRRSADLSDGLDAAAHADPDPAAGAGAGADERPAPEPQPIRIVRRRDSPFGP
jgi:malonyl-CoA O-methyltransferase